MKHLLLVSVFMCLAGASSHASPEVDTPSELPAMHIYTDLFKVTFTADKNGIVDTAEVTSVLPNSAASKRDIKPQDELLEIDHKPIKGMRYSDAQALIEHDLKPGEKRTFTFHGRRGIFGQRRIRYEFVVVGRSSG